VNEQARAPLAHVRQDRAVHSLHAEDIHIEDTAPVVRSEGLLNAKHSEAGIVDHDIQATHAVERLGNGRLDAAVVSNVHLDDLRPDTAELLSRCLVSSLDVPHGRDYRVPPLQERCHGHLAESTACPGNQNDRHGFYPLVSGFCLRM